MIGGGAYGEVWLASGVTGAMRAVKVVRREDFEDEVTFEREFEGILKYEPLSRDHPGLVHILHVGRSVDAHESPFYYYVMELGDDVHTGTNINAPSYEARNLLTDMKHSGGSPHDPDEVITIGLGVSEALGFLHENGLVHRDVKPSNVIFVDGRAKLADIGLVAARGQRTFVGTEGFVPPEGPGSAQADVYALGKVLYEMASGKDRLNFPELPDELPSVMHKKRWLGLNQLICDTCEARVEKREIKTADAMADGLRRIESGRRLKRRRDKVIISTVLSLFFISMVTWLLGSQIRSVVSTVLRPADEPPTTPITVEETQYGFIKVLSSPSGAEVYDINGDFIDFTPLKNIKMKAGTQYSFEFRLDGYRTSQESGEIMAHETHILEHSMVVYSPPIQGQSWVDHYGVSYKPEGDKHVSEYNVSYNRWRKYLNQRKIKGSQPAASVKPTQPALVTEKEAGDYAAWLSETGRARGYLNEVQNIYAQVNKGYNTHKQNPKAKKNKRYPFRTVVKNIQFARVELHSSPEGASIYINGDFIGLTPIYAHRVIPGEATVTMTYEGYRKISQAYQLKENSHNKINLKMKRNQSVVFGEKWANSLGMNFVPIDDKGELLVSIWETRSSDFSVYGKLLRGRKVNINRLDHPALGISRQQASAFCERLTEAELKTEIIPEGSRYRLLTDQEWSLIAGLDEPAGLSPAEREVESPNVFPWGGGWLSQPLDAPMGNFAGEEARPNEGVDQQRVIKGYTDGYVESSPVGSFPPNSLGIYDLAGNVYEWVSDSYSEGSDYGVLRGGSWKSHIKEHLYSGHRNVVRLTPTQRYKDFGFRILLEKE